MNDLSEDFKERLKRKKEGLELESSPLSLFKSISEEMDSEIENNKILKFKKNLSESRKLVETKPKADLSSFFSALSENTEPFESSEIIHENVFDFYETEEQKPQQIITEEPTVITPDLISAAVKSISKEEELKSKEPIPEDYTNLFSNPEVTKTDPTVKSLQTKMKFLEEWISKISMAGPGGGSGSILDLDTPVISVNTDYTMNRKDYCLLVNPSVKTYINLPPAYDERKVIIKDISGHAQLTPIRINGTIDGDPNGAEIRVNYAALQLIYYNNSWWII